MEPKSIPARATTWFVLCSIVAVLYVARDFLLPIALAIFVAFVLAPLVRRLERTGLGRGLATILTMGVVGVVVGAIGWVLVIQLRLFADSMPEYRQNVRAKAADVRELIESRIAEATNTVRTLGEDLSSSVPGADAVETIPVVPVTDATNGSWLGLQDALGSVAAFSAVAALVFLFAFVMLLRWEDLLDRVLALAGENDLDVTSRAAKEASAKVGLYMRRQLLVNGIHGTAVALILWGVGVPTPLVWGFLGATLRFVPYLGPIIGTAAPILVSFASSDGWTQTWLTAGALVGLEVITNNVLEPWIYGACTGISPLALLVSAAFWTWIWGVMGLVLSTPLTVCLLVIGKRYRSLRFFDVLFSDEPALPSRSRLYHRLLANDQDEAWEVLREEVERTSLVDATDRTLIPALGLAGTARSDGRLDAEARERVGVLAHGLVDELEELPRTPPSPAPTGAARVLCFPARDSFDAVGGRILVRELERHGVPATTASPDRLLGEVLESVRQDEVDVVVISSVVPTHFLHVRTLCKRLLAVDSDVQILVGLWGESMSNAESLERLPQSPRVHVVSHIAEAIAWCQDVAPQMVPHRVAAPETAPQPGPGPASRKASA